MANEFDPEIMAPQSGSSGGGLPAEANGLSEGAKQFIRQYVPKDDDEGCIGGFEYVNEFKPFKSKEETEKQGKLVEIFENVLFIRINIRGSDLREVHRPATDADKRRFPYAWQEFQRGENARARGIPLQKLGIDAPLIRGFAAKNVFTIEDLSVVSDNNLQNLGIGAREMRARAQEYLRTNSLAAQAAEEIPSLKDAIADQQRKIQAQSDQLAQALALVERMTEENRKLSSASEKRGPGRPPKTPLEE